MSNPTDPWQIHHPWLVEVWKPLAPDTGYPGYEVSNAGRVRGVPRKAWTGGDNFRSVPSRILKSSIHGGRASVQLSDGRGKFKRFDVANLVANAFIGPPPVDSFLVHLDSNPENCEAGNLYWFDVFGNNTPVPSVESA